MFLFIRLFMQEKFVCVDEKGEVHFRDGRQYPGTHRRFLMEHSGSRNKTTAGEMWDFVGSIGNHKVCSTETQMTEASVFLATST